MQKLPKILLAGAAITVAAVVVARATARPAIQKIATSVKSAGHFSSSILLWVRPDKPRDASMSRWKGPHAKIIAATKGFEEYRQLHFREQNTGLWPATPGVETAIPAGRRGSFAELSAAFRKSALPSKGFFPFLPFFIKSVQPLKAKIMQRLHFHQAPFGRLKSRPLFLGIVGRKIREKVFQKR